MLVVCTQCVPNVHWLAGVPETLSKVTLREGLQESGLDTWSSETSVLSAASAAQPQALSTWTSETSALSAASSAQSHASSAIASSVGSSHTGSAQHGPRKARKPEPAKVEERVKLVPMLHPDQRQHKEARLQVWHSCEFCVCYTSEIHRARDTMKVCGFCASLM